MRRRCTLTPAAAALNGPHPETASTTSARDCLVAFEANLYSVPAARVFHRQLVEVRASALWAAWQAGFPPRADGPDNCRKVPGRTLRPWLT
jgi:hypothetical protein